VSEHRWPRVEQLAASIVREGADASERLRLAVDASRRLHDLSDELVERFVTDARRDGLSWAEIGDLFGTSKQAAQKRYGAASAAGDWPNLAAAAQEAMSRASDEARRLDHTYVGTEHALVGLLDTERGTAAHVLAQLGVRRSAVLAQTCLSRGEGALPLDCLGVRPRLKRALERATQLARELGHDRADTEHLLATIVQDPQAMATELLRRVGVRPGDVLRELGRRLEVDPDTLVVGRPRRRRRLRRATA